MSAAVGGSAPRPGDPVESDVGGRAEVAEQSRGKAEGTSQAGGKAARAQQTGGQTEVVRQAGEGVGKRVAVVPVRDGVVPLGADEAVAEAGGVALIVGTGTRVAAGAQGITCTGEGS